jgi:acetylornithine deacetylase/succinyl-diaminopimelate desuccinylase-like protein
MLDKVLQTIDDRRQHSLDLLKQWLAIPSVSAKPAHKADMQTAAAWVGDQLRFGGFDVTIGPTPGHPIVIARNKHQPGRPTVLFYGHYDVQPPEPLDLWTTPAFEPTIRNDATGHPAVFARGAADDKGQVWCAVEAALAWQAHGGLPVNLTMVIEGEEEVGSDNLEAFVQQHKHLLKADVCVIHDTNQFARGLPAITYGLRGLVYEEIFLTGPSHDLHSGLYGGTVPNPANVLCEILASLHDDQGRVNIPGFYDDVVPLTAQERELWKQLPFDERAFYDDLKLPFGAGEAGYTPLERKWARPTCDINGLTAGYQGPGAKTVIASKASAKVSMRLVPKQDPVKIQQAFQTTIQARCPMNVRVEFKSYGASAPVLVPIDSRAIQLAAEALEKGFGTRPTFMREGGSIPVVAMIKRVLGIDTLLVGYGLPDDRVHSPDEKFDLDALHRGTRTTAALFERLAHL